MNKTKEQQAQQYAKNKSIALRKAWYLYRYGGMYDLDDWTRDTVKPSDNFEYGFNAGYTACEQSMWRSVEEELPEFDKRVLICERVADKQKVFIGRRIQFCNGGWGWSQSTKESVTHWGELPSFPETNTEKK